MRAAQFLSFAERLILECGAQSELVRLRDVFDQWQTHLEPPSLEAALTQAETWTLGEAITYALKNDN
jgi:hypothetical protein